LSQQAQLALFNLQAFQIVNLMGDGIQYEEWMQFTHMDLVRFAIQRSQNAQRGQQSPPKSSRQGRVNEEVEYEDLDEQPYNSSRTDTDEPLVHTGEHSTSTENKTLTKNSCLKGIRRDVNAYKDFKEDRYYDSWIKSVKANAKLHGISKVLDKDYKPVGDDAISEFEDMQTYMWAIIVNTVKTPTGKQLIREHDGDAQTIFSKLHHELKSSQKAEFSADDLHDKIKALSLSKWTGTFVSFLEHWSAQLFLWCELVAGTRADPDDGEKKKMLKASVSSIPVMASIATQEVIDIAKGHIKWTYNVYYDILMRQAIDDDRSKNRITRTTETTTAINKATRAANQAESGRGCGRDGRGRDRGRGRDGRGRGRGGRGGRGESSARVPYEIWKELSVEAKAIIQGSQQRKTIAEH
jgi:hypothetical protein